MKIKNVLYSSCLCSSIVEQKIMKMTPEKIGLQIQKYHRLLTKGFINNNVNVYALSYQNGIEVISIEKSNTIENGISFQYIKKGKLAYLGILASSFIYSLRYLITHPDTIVVCDVLNYTVSLGAALAGRLLRCRVLGIITDFPEHLTDKKSYFSDMIWRLINLCTDYIILTRHMKERLNEKKPSLVLEGHVDSSMHCKPDVLDKKYDKKICIYAGLLHKKYGIETLVEAFKRINIPEAELHLYGQGDYSEELLKNKRDNIKYYGIVPNNVVVQEEMKATLLINPRPTTIEFTKYSFPSKNMEYMASGTAVLTTMLPGMPVEYNKYVYLFTDETIEGMSKTLSEVLSKDRDELIQMGKEAKLFVLKNKTETIQAKKILEFVEQMS